MEEATGATNQISTTFWNQFKDAMKEKEPTYQVMNGVVVITIPEKKMNMNRIDWIVKNSKQPVIPKTIKSNLKEIILGFNEIISKIESNKYVTAQHLIDKWDNYVEKWVNELNINLEP